MNTGGVRLSQCLNALDVPDIESSPAQLCDSLFIAANAYTTETILTKNYSKGDVAKFCQYIYKAAKMSVEKDTLPKLNTSDSSRNQSILTKLISFK